MSLWLPRLQELNAAFLVLKSPTKRAIPENFITTLAKQKIDLVMDFNLPLSEKTPWADIETLLRAYGKWGAKYALLNHQPNNQAAWGEKYWKQTGLVKSHTKQFIEFAKLALDCGLKPIFSPLVPGGDYWDTAFLQEALQILSKSADPFIINNMIMSAYAWDFDKSLDWGKGGQKVWKNTRPYKVPRSSQDQRGFRAHEWYTECTQKILGKSLPIMLFQAGINMAPNGKEFGNQAPNTTRLQYIYSLLKGKNVYDHENKTNLVNAISPNVLACNFYLLCADDTSNKNFAWFSPKGMPTQVSRKIFRKFGQADNANAKASPHRKENEQPKNHFKYGRYVLIAESLKPDIQELLKKMHGYITRYKPVIGFSADEAMQSAYILVIAKNGDFSQENIQQLQHNGSLVKVLQPDEIRDSIK